MDNSKKKRLTVGIVLGVVFVLTLTVVLLFVPYNATALDSSLKKAAKAEITSITVQTSPCCGAPEGPRRTYTNSSKEFIANFKVAAKNAKANRDMAALKGGSDVQLTITTTDGVYKVNFEQGSIVTNTGKFRIRDWKSWEFIYVYPSDTLIENEY